VRRREEEWRRGCLWVERKRSGGKGEWWPKMICLLFIIF
jgi:hypothetical protein